MFEAVDRGFGRAACRSVAMGPEAAAPYRALSNRVLAAWAEAERARVALLRAVAEWDDADASVIDGTAPQHWLRHRLATTSTDARRLLTVARGLAAHDVVATALADGAITTAKAEIILAAFTRPVSATPSVTRRCWPSMRHGCHVPACARSCASGPPRPTPQPHGTTPPTTPPMIPPTHPRRTNRRTNRRPTTDPGDQPRADASPEAGSGTLHLAATFEGITELQATLTPKPAPWSTPHSSSPWPKTVAADAPPSAYPTPPTTTRPNTKTTTPIRARPTGAAWPSDAPTPS